MPETFEHGSDEDDALMTGGAPPAPDQTELEEDIRDMLLNSEARIGGAVGVGYHDEALTSMRITGLIGPKGGLTKKGAARARKIQDEYYGPKA